MGTPADAMKSAVLPYMMSKPQILFYTLLVPVDVGKNRPDRAEAAGVPCQDEIADFRWTRRSEFRRAEFVQMFHHEVQVIVDLLSQTAKTRCRHPPQTSAR